MKSALNPKMRSFLDEQVNRHVITRDQLATPIPKDIFIESAELGLFSASLSKNIGGGGLDPLSYGLLLEDLGKHSTDFSFVMLSSLFPAVANTIQETATPWMIERYLRPAVHGKCLASFAYTEGADPFSFRSSCEKKGDKYIINGEKFYVMGGMQADLFMVYVRDEKNDLLTFLIERDDDGLEIIPLTTMSGLRSVGLAGLKFNNIVLDANRILTPADGLSHVQRFLNLRRISVICGLVGKMQSIYDDLMNNLIGTTRYERPLTVMQNVQSLLGKMYVSIETSRAMLYRALEKLRDKNIEPLWDPFLTATKYHIVDQANQFMLQVFRLAGGKGYIQDQQYGRFQRDFTGLIPTVGAQDTIEVDLGVWATHNFEQRQHRKKAP
ncbi:MAG: acyl-CoA dehydrogenase family protein [Pseudomonadota bacterium]|nr:acyl-CoA dehydrogenase family protein [Pseudomonadota bacterium]